MILSLVVAFAAFAFQIKPRRGAEGAEPRNFC